MKKDKGNWKFFIIGAAVFVIFIFPLYWMVVTALKTQVEIFEIPTPLWPRNLTFEAFADQLSVSGKTLQGFKNSLIIGCGATVISTLLAIPASYGLARFRFSGRKILIPYFLLISRIVFSPPPFSVTVFLTIVTFALVRMNRENMIDEVLI